jgi:Ca-activated chloride channel family protein
MTRPGLGVLDAAELARFLPTDPDGGLGALRTPAGNLPLRRLVVQAHLVGLTSRVLLTQRFVNPHSGPLEATYVFPLPDRGAVTALRMTADGRTVVADLREREQARREYDEAVASGRRASIAEEERSDVFTLRVGNILPGEEVTVELTVVGVLPVVDGAATFRFPLVVAPRYVPGAPLPGDAVGSGWQPDTDAVPDASRISPPVLLPGFPNPVQLDVEIHLDPAGLEMGEPRSSLHAVRVDDGVIRFEPGERVDRDIVLRIPMGRVGAPSAALALVPDESDESGGRGTFELTVLPPDLAAVPHPRDVVLLLDRSGSMSGWKMVAARRAAARIVDTLTDGDRFAVLAFDDRVDLPSELGAGLVPATDRNRFRAVEFLAGLGARGGTELSEPLGRGLRLLTDSTAGPASSASDRVLVLVTDGQVGNEDQLLRGHAARLGAVRVHAVGIDRAVNAGFLGRLAAFGGGRCELVESHDRLDEAMANIHRRIGSPLVTGVSIDVDGLAVEPGSLTPARLPDVFPGVPHVVRGRYTSAGDAVVRLRGTAPDGTAFVASARGLTRHEPAVTAAWARARLRDLEDRYAACAEGRFAQGGEPDVAGLEQEIVATSLRFGVLSRFTAFVAVDDRVVTDGSAPTTIVQPVELPSGWDCPPMGGGAAPMVAMRFAAPAPPHLSGSPAPGAASSLSVTAFGTGLIPSAAARVGRSGWSAEGQEAGAADDGAQLRPLLALEANRLRALVDEPDHRRRDALLDLGSRLAALASSSADERWRELLRLLEPERVAAEPLGDLWDAVLRLIDALSLDRDRAEPRRGDRPAGSRPSFFERGR